jgi:hypothetical protein
MASTLERLQRWYESHCDDEWEHAHGVRIGTLDNPGWSIEVNLDGTAVRDRPFDRHQDGEGDENYDDEGRQIGPWLTARIEEQDGERRRRAACGPNDLERALVMFLDWAERGAATRPA